jgi:hypothetical protein
MVGTMQELTTVLENATRAIAQPYFQLPIHGGPAVYRERVYCYELYHQMRCLWPQNTPFILNGEVDKRGHPLLADRLNRLSQPDLLVHGPGDMNRNHAIIEVKSATVRRRGILKDLLTLTDFVMRAEYQRAIYVIYGTEAGVALVEEIQMRAAELNEIASIEVWQHRCLGEPAVHCTTLPVRAVAQAH